MKNYKGFESGDVVQLASDGPRMTVVGVASRLMVANHWHVSSEFKDSGATYLFCQWFVDGRLYDGVFEAGSLESVRSNNSGDENIPF